MLKFVASPLSCKTFQVRITEQRSARDVKTLKSTGKPNAEWLVRDKIDQKKSSAFLSSLGSGLKQNQQSVSPPFSFV